MFAQLEPMLRRHMFQFTTQAIFQAQSDGRTDGGRATTTGDGRRTTYDGRIMGDERGRNGHTRRGRTTDDDDGRTNENTGKPGDRTDCGTQHGKAAELEE